MLVNKNQLFGCYKPAFTYDTVVGEKHYSGHLFFSEIKSNLTLSNVAIVRENGA